MSTDLIELSATDLACERGGRLVFSGLNFTVSGGEALVVTGRNGAGKSTLLRLIAGLLRQSAGRLNLTGGAANQQSQNNRTISAISTR